MWDRARASSATAEDVRHRTTAATRRQNHKLPQRLSCIDGAETRGGEARSSWPAWSSYPPGRQRDVGSPPNALGIAGPQKHRDARLRTSTAASTCNLVAPRTEIEIFPPTIPIADAALSRPICEPPPRNPRRLLRLHQGDGAWCPHSTLCDGPESSTDSEANFTSDGDGDSSSATSNFKLASRYAYGRPALDQISPPSSPDVSPVQDGRLAGDVSPIDDEADLFQQNFLKGDRQTQPKTRYSRSSAPMTQRNHRCPQVEAVGPVFKDPRLVEVCPAAHGSLPRSNRMRFSSIGNVKGSDRPINSHHHSSSIASNSFGQRMRLLGRNKVDPTNGQSELEQHLGDDSNGLPLNIPQKSSKRASRAGALTISAPLPLIGSSSEFEAPYPLASITDPDLLPLILNRSPLNTATPVNKSRSAANTTDGAQTLPTPPHYAYPTPPSHTTTQSNRARSPFGLGSTPGSARAIRRKPPQSAHLAAASDVFHPLASSPVTWDTPPRKALASIATPPSDVTPPRRSNTGEAWTQSPSRFSVTTYATSNPGTPRQPIDQQMPTATQQAGANPVLGRDSPDASADDPALSSTQSPFISSPNPAQRYDAETADRSSNPQSHVRAKSTSSSTSHQASVLSASKPLPPAPPEISPSEDRISQLNVYLAGLAHRRVNISKSIKQMTELMPRDNLLASEEVLRKREDEKHKVEGLKQELAEIQREEYESGLKLHRAYKRLDKHAEYEPTTLWVRRIAS